MQESPFILDVNLGAISRLETISVPNQGENTKGLELVCKVTLTYTHNLWLTNDAYFSWKTLFFIS